MTQQNPSFEAQLNGTEKSASLASYITRRLAAIGTIYALVFGAFLLLAFAWKEEAKDGKPALNLFSYFDKSVFEPVMSTPVQAAVAVILLLLCVDWRLDGRLPERIGGTLIVAALVVPAVFLHGDALTLVLVRFLHAVLLLACGLILDRTFGYTRAHARSQFYLTRVETVNQYTDEAKKEEELRKLAEACAVDKYRDYVGDTFFTLDALKAKLGS
ncbi:hypothetical protein IP92_03616 [Pseudoduganella flava]|uniref:Uncharacterized protein n=1 Tax=Pseudoduganella flava TaxID=871742 RepID=A0A562PM14_9BURK|nr:hypothetical protein [Pseudoduganella flava]QGZ41057.1 hypothetical protein GO485_19630 [Pseudoduganella flava]TWI45240.1 hypothetical protein IP92_03616 [Pseudoduganella flava]